MILNKALSRGLGNPHHIQIELTQPRPVGGGHQLTLQLGLGPVHQHASIEVEGKDVVALIEGGLAHPRQRLGLGLRLQIIEIFAGTDQPVRRREMHYIRDLGKTTPILARFTPGIAIEPLATRFDEGDHLAHDGLPAGIAHLEHGLALQLGTVGGELLGAIEVGGKVVAAPITKTQRAQGFANMVPDLRLGNAAPFPPIDALGDGHRHLHLLTQTGLEGLPCLIALERQVIDGGVDLGLDGDALLLDIAEAQLFGLIIEGPVALQGQKQPGGQGHQGGHGHHIVEEQLR